MRFIITGGTGLIGRTLSADLIHDGHEVIILSRHPERAKDVPEGARIEAWDAQTESGWASFVEGAHTIINLAGEDIAENRWTEEHKRWILESRINAGKAVVRAVERACSIAFSLITGSTPGRPRHTGQV